MSAPPPGRLVVVSGPSGAGKGTVVGGVLARRPETILSVSATTRTPRPEERDGTDYRFLSQESFRALAEIGELLEWAEVYGHLYGTPRRPVEDALAAGHDVVLEVDVQGALQVRESLPDAVLVFIKPPSLEELEARLTGRGTENAGTLARRTEAARGELEHVDRYDHVIVNDRADDAVTELLRILDG
ncbi:MAG: guanylate kinase [Actinobacteria bacterium]|nr:guanylate kinase [Actinomycetota bacterium]MDQ3219063.1 guanylate kinase [Actinomycetota bacterium]